MEDGVQAIAKVPNPNAGLPHYSTASEVTTMDFVRTKKTVHLGIPLILKLQVRNRLKVPAPKVYVWSSRPTENSDGAEYIITEKVLGVRLSKKWADLKGQDQQRVIEQVIGFETALSSATFKKFGSLYFSASLISDKVIHENTIHCNNDGEKTDGGRFSVGPSTDRKSFDDGRGAVNFDRGPRKIFYPTS